MPRIERVEILDDREYQGGAEEGREVEATETRELTVNGKTYRTYLSKDNADQFDADLAPWLEYAEVVEHTQVPTARRAPRKASSGPRRDRTESTDIRAWAMDQQFTPPVSERGRIPQTVIDAYYAAHPDKPRPATSAA
jgi:CHAD domain-containing protein